MDSAIIFLFLINMSDANASIIPVLKGKYSFLLLDAMLKHNYPSMKWVVEGLLPEEGMMAVSGDPGSYKTWIMMDMAIAVASGKDFLGRFPTQQGAVMLVDEENPQRLLQERFKRMEIAEEGLPIYILSLSGFRLNEENVRSLLHEVQRLEIKMIIFDSLVRIHDAEENDAKKMAEVFAKLKKFVAAGISIVFIHHNRKQLGGGMAQAMRGSSDILASVDSHVAVRLDHETGIILLEQTKSRFDRRIHPVEVQVIHSGGKTTFNLIGEYEGKGRGTKKDKAIELVVEALLESEQGYLSQNQIVEVGKKSGIGRNTILEAIKDLIKSSDIDATMGKGHTTFYSLKKSEEPDRSISDSSITPVV